MTALEEASKKRVRAKLTAAFVVLSAVFLIVYLAVRQ